MRRIFGKVPTFAIFIVAAVLVGGIVALMHFKFIKPQKEELTRIEQELAAEEAVAAERAQAEQRLAEVQAQWLEAQDRLAQLRKKRSFWISTYQPIAAMIALWYEYRDDLPRVTKEWLDSTGVTLNSNVTFPTPDMAPPQVPGGGFITLPGPISLSISGTLAQIESFYSSLGNYKRVARISGLQLSGEGDTLNATVPVSLYLLIETPAPAPAPAAAPAAAGGLPGAPGGMPGEIGPGGPGGMPGGPGGMPPDAGDIPPDAGDIPPDVGGPGGVPPEAAP